MKRTLLDMTQSILIAMESDNVSSITDTTESIAVSEILKDTYYELLNDRIWPSTKEFIDLAGSSDASYPTRVSIPVDTIEISWVQYDNGADGESLYEDLEYQTPEEFMRQSNGRKESASDVEVMIYDGKRVKIGNSSKPVHWTSFDDEYIILDSYDEDVESTIQSSNLLAYGSKEPVFTMSDAFVPDIPTKVFEYYLAEAKSVAFNQVRQEPNNKEEQRSKRQRAWLARNKYVTNGDLKKHTYGRRSPKI